MTDDGGWSPVGTAPNDPRRAIPGTDALLAAPALADAAQRLGRDVVKRAIHRAQQRARAGAIDPTDVVDAVLVDLPRGPRSIERVINATGVVVHTNLGRAPLSTAARRAISDAAGYTTVELDLRTGERADRGTYVLDLLAAVAPGAEAAMVVNNNAAALVLVTMTLGAGREVVISKGELVEIGDGFRIPDLLLAAGAHLREVGATNRTTLTDYAEAISPDTGFVIKVHRANFAVSGYTGEVGVEALGGLPTDLVVDIGSGLLRPHPALPDEPDVASTLAAGADLVTASADKLLGGPQAGLIFGRADLIQRLRRHPIARAMRVDKLTLAALEATLRALPAPVLRMITESYESVRSRAHRLADILRDGGVLDVEVIDTDSAVGGGGAPTLRLASAAVSLPGRFAAPLRLAAPAVVGRVERRRCLLDLRTVSDDELDDLRAAVLAVDAASEHRI
jgi:L-seryl-tRNA(Ser) seleniumtransferase